MSVWRFLARSQSWEEERWGATRCKREAGDAAGKRKELQTRERGREQLPGSQSVLVSLRVERGTAEAARERSVIRTFPRFFIFSSFFFNGSQSPGGWVVAPGMGHRTVTHQLGCAGGELIAGSPRSGVSEDWRTDTLCLERRQGATETLRLDVGVSKAETCLRGAKRI